MASPSKKGLRCGKRIGGCSGLLLEDDPRGLGVRCSKKNCRAFHPLEVLLSQAVEQKLLGPEQLARIRNVTLEERGNPLIKEPERKTEENMTTAQQETRGNDVRFENDADSEEKAKKVLQAFLVTLETFRGVCSSEEEIKRVEDTINCSRCFSGFLPLLYATGVPISVETLNPSNLFQDFVVAIKFWTDAKERGGEYVTIQMRFSDRYCIVIFQDRESKDKSSYVKARFFLSHVRSFALEEIRVHSLPRRYTIHIHCENGNLDIAIGSNYKSITL